MTPLSVPGFATFFAAVTLALHATAAFAEATASLELVQTIALPDVRGRVDHLDVDTEGGRLFIAALGNDTVEVIDLRTGQRSARLLQLKEPQGVAYLPASKRLFVANGGSGRVAVYANDVLAPAAWVDGLEDADNVRYEHGSGHVYVGYGRALAVIDSASATLLGQIRLAGHPESFQLETGGSRVFVNVPSAAQIAVIDRTRRAVIATWNLDNMRANFPMALDEADHRLFVATRSPPALVVVDTDNGKPVANVAIGADADDLFYDAQRNRVYAICGEGLVDILQQRDADHYYASGRVATARGARTGLFVPERDALYVAVPARGTSSAEVRVYAVH